MKHCLGLVKICMCANVSMILIGCGLPSTFAMDLFALQLFNAFVVILIGLSPYLISYAFSFKSRFGDSC